MNQVSTEHGVIPFDAQELKLSKEDCADIIDLCNYIHPTRGQLQKENSADTNVNTKKRDVTVYPIDDILHDDNMYLARPFDPENLNYNGKVCSHQHGKVSGILTYIAEETNRVFNYDLWEFEHHKNSFIQESPQLLKYEAPSTGYDWHHDLGNGDAAERKASISIFLNDDYEGGEFCFFDKGEVIAPSSVGNAVAFSSFIPHRVKPITKGVRWSLVAWIAGPPFK
tara:strand:+ start:1661 stop:2335 length:675 start_codon:yes stop_codon:yes gene_type:complete